jgi:hypothetical protein
VGERHHPPFVPCAAAGANDAEALHLGDRFFDSEVRLNANTLFTKTQAKAKANKEAVLAAASLVDFKGAKPRPDDKLTIVGHGDPGAQKQVIVEGLCLGGEGGW